MSKEFIFPVPDFFESFEILQLSTVLRKMNSFENNFQLVDTISGAEQMSMKQVVRPGKHPQIIGQVITLSLPGRMSLQDEEAFVAQGLASGWSRVKIKTASAGCTTYSKFYLSRLFA